MWEGGVEVGGMVGMGHAKYYPHLYNGKWFSEVSRFGWIIEMKIDNKSGFGFGLIHSFGTKLTLSKSSEFSQVREFGVSVMFFFHSLCGSGKVEKAY